MNTKPAPPAAGFSDDQGPVVGVKTTGIYCRMTCRPGRAPKRENCVPYLNGAAARMAGYRPCKQCRPDEVRPMLTIFHGSRQTPLGILFAARTDRGACALYLLNHEHDQSALNRTRKLFPKATLTESLEAVEPIIALAVAHVMEGQSCDDLALDLHGTPFQRRVWEALRAIPRGETTTYGALTRSLGLAPGTARAVGSACGTNPVSLIVPCHRVLGATGGLGGYYWGLDRKKAFLEMEGVALPASRAAIVTA